MPLKTKRTAAAATFGNENYVFWEVSSTPTYSRLKKLDGVMVKFFREKNGFWLKCGAAYAKSAT